MSKKIVISVIAVAGVALLVGGGVTLENYLAQVAGDTTKKENCALSPRPREFDHKTYYIGPLIDAHLHLPSSSGIVSAVSAQLGLPTPAWSKNLSVDYLNCFLEAEGALTAFGFHLLTKYSSSGEVKIAKQMEKKYPGRITHFLMPALISPWINVGTDTVKNALSKNPGLFKGIGELKMFDGRSLDDPYLIEMYELARKHKLVVMIHPFSHHEKVVEKILKEYSDVKFLLHGVDNKGWLMDLIRKYDNVYYSLDANLSSLYGWKPEHEDHPIGKEEYLAYIRKNFDHVLDRALNNWKAEIEAYPNRFMSGTDRWHGWMFDAEVGGLVIEFSRAFIGKLDSAVQERYAYKNAQKLIQ